MAKIIVWGAEEAQKELAKRLSYAQDVRQRYEKQWAENERTLFNTRGDNFASAKVQLSFDNFNELGVEGVDTSGTNYGINYAFKNYRLIHSQLSANPPSVIPRPTSPDPSDRRKADAADRLVRYGLRQYRLQEMQDRAAQMVLVYGSAFGKSIWNPELGEILEFDEELSEVLMTGDIEICIPSTWNIFPDPDATEWVECKYIFERLYLPYEQAISMFPQAREALEKYRTKQQHVDVRNGTNTIGDLRKYDVVEVFQYWEKGLPYNGMVGRFCYHLQDGTLLTPIKANPFRFAPPADKGIETAASTEKQHPGVARLPYHLWTDIDLPGTIWGQSFVSYETPLQELYNRMLNVSIDVLQAQGIPRMILPEGADVEETSVTNSPWDIIKISGNATPYFMQPFTMPGEFARIFDVVRAGIDDMGGVNEAMFGQQSRETSGFSMQYATNQGNLIRRRLFNKYVLFVESLYKGYLDLIRKHWTETRKIAVLGTENAFKAIDISGADIDGGYDLVVEYGASLSLDPTLRRDEILKLMPIFKEAGIDTRYLAQMLKLNELDGLYDYTEMADNRQREIFEEMMASKVYIPPEEMQDHANMLKYAYRYIMTSEFKYLAKEDKDNIIRHIKEREQLEASGAAGGMAAAGAGAAQAGAPQPGGPALPGPGAPLDVTQLGPGIAPQG
jgi:hypothetical protein